MHVVWDAHIPAILWTIAVVIFIYRVCDHRTKVAEARLREIRKLQKLAAEEVEWAEKQAAEEFLSRQSRVQSRVHASIFPTHTSSVTPVISRQSPVSIEAAKSLSLAVTTDSVKLHPPASSSGGSSPVSSQQASLSGGSSPVLSRQASLSGSTRSSTGLGACAVCGSPTKKQCSRCKAVKYCSQQCQFQHWRDGHKHECRELEKKLITNSAQAISSSNSDTRDSPDNSGSTSGKKDNPNKDKNLSVESLRPSNQPRDLDKSTSNQNQSSALGIDAGKENQSQTFNEGFEYKNISRTSETVNGNGNGNANQLKTLESFSSERNPSKASETVVPSRNHSKALESTITNRNQSKSLETLSTNSDKPKPLKTTTNRNQLKAPVKVTTNGNAPKPSKVLFPYDQFRQLFMWNKLKLLPCGLVNCGNSCFANVVLQCLTYTRPLAAYLLEERHSGECQRNNWCFMCELEKHVLRVKQSQIPFSPINIVSKIPNIGNHMGYGKQEDAHEFMRFAIDFMQSVCLDRVGGEKSVDQKTKDTTFIQHIFGGYLQSQVKCTECHHVSQKYENMMDLAVEIQGNVETLEDALAQFTSPEWLVGDNKYKCDRCNDYVKACKRLGVHEAPNILTIALKRFQSGKYGKLNKRVKFPDVLDISPYMTERRDKPPVYQLFGVIVHIDISNASYYGHYICYIKDLQGSWYKLDDSKVKQVDIGDAMKQTAYMLLYARSSPRDAPLSSGSANPPSSDAMNLCSSHSGTVVSNGHSLLPETSFFPDEADENNIGSFYSSDGNGGLFSGIANILEK